MEFPIRKLIKHQNVCETLAWWKKQFGDAFSSIRPFLFPCAGRRGNLFPSPDDPSVLLTIEDEGDRYRAIPPDHLKHKVDDVLLDLEDVQAYGINCDILRTSLRETLELKPATSHLIEGLFYIGRCVRSGTLRHVYACLALTDQEVLRIAETCTDPKKTGCILFPARHAKAFELLRSRGIAAVALRECLSIKPDGFHGKCPGTCTGCLPPSSVTVQLESRLDTIEKTVLPDARRGSITKTSASEGGKARAKTYEPKYEEARLFMLDYHIKHPNLSFTQIRKKAAQHLYLAEITLKKHINKGDFPDW